MSAKNCVDEIINDHPKKTIEVLDEDINSLTHKDLQAKLKIIVKELEIQHVSQENLSMKLQIIEA